MEMALQLVMKRNAYTLFELLCTLAFCGCLCMVCASAASSHTKSHQQETLDLLQSWQNRAQRLTGAAAPLTALAIDNDGSCCCLCLLLRQEDAWVVSEQMDLPKRIRLTGDSGGTVSDYGATVVFEPEGVVGAPVWTFSEGDVSFFYDF